MQDGGARGSFHHARRTVHAHIEELKAKKDPGYFDEYLIKAAASWPHDNETAKVPVQVIRIGDIGLAALPAEIFSGIGLEIKRYSPFRHTLVVELANARSSVYIPTVAQAERGDQIETGLQY